MAHKCSHQPSVGLCASAQADADILKDSYVAHESQMGAEMDGKTPLRNQSQMVVDKDWFFLLGDSCSLDDAEKIF